MFTTVFVCFCGDWKRFFRWRRVCLKLLRSGLLINFDFYVNVWCVHSKNIKNCHFCLGLKIILFFLLGAFGWLGISMGCLDMSKSCNMSIEYVFIFTHLSQYRIRIDLKYCTTILIDKIYIYIYDNNIYIIKWIIQSSKYNLQP